MIPSLRESACLLLAVALWAGSSATASAQLIAIAAPPGGTSEALGISADGSTVVGFVDTGSTQAFRWQGGTTTLLGTTGSVARAVSGDGAVVVGQQGLEAFRWVGADTTGEALGSLLAPPSNVVARGVSADGTIIVGESNSPSGSREAFRWTQAGGMVGLGDLSGGSFLSIGDAISADGSTIVGRGLDATATHAVVFHTLPTLPTSLDSSTIFSEALGVSADGSVVVGFIGTGASERAFLSSTSGPLMLLDASTRALATGVSADGSVIVGRMFIGSSQEAFIWDATNGMRTLESVASAAGIDLTGWELRRATGISADGQTIVGWGDFTPSGSPDPIHQGFVLHLNISAVPEPTADILTVLTVSGLLLWMRKRNRRNKRDR